MLSREQRDRIISLRKADVNIVDIASLTGIPKSTVGDYVAGKTYGNEYAELTGEVNTWAKKMGETVDAPTSISTQTMIGPNSHIVQEEVPFDINKLSEALDQVLRLESITYPKDEEDVYDLGENIIVISDTHFPYHHPDTFEFLETVKHTYGITGAVSVGDMNDNHYPSYHELEPDCHNGVEELRLAREACQRLEEIFPRMLISEGNHDILPKRKANSAQVPLEWVSSPNHVYQLKGGWSWASHHYFDVGGQKCLLVHSVGTNVVTNSRRYSHCSVQGHHHGTFGVSYAADTEVLRWHMSVGCLIDPKAPAFRYDKKQILSRPILGCGVIIKGVPINIPMVLDGEGRWIGRKK